MIFPMFPALGLGMLGAGLLQWRDARPRACPRCGNRSVIPVAILLRPKSRRPVETGKHGWCTVCGEDCERQVREDWAAVEKVESHPGEVEV